MTIDAQLDELLAFDPLSEAERITGKDSADDDETQAIGFMLLQRRSQARDKILTERGDTIFHNPLERYMDIIEHDGFEIVYTEPFTNHDRDECFYIAWHPDGLLLTFDTYYSDQVNGGMVYFNWRPIGDIQEWWRWTESGHMWVSDDYDADIGSGDRVWVGTLDCREALIYRLTGLRENGEFVTPWIEAPLYSLAHHGDRAETGKPNDPGWAEKRRDLRANRHARLPERVRKAIGPPDAEVY